MGASEETGKEESVMKRMGLASGLSGDREGGVIDEEKGMSARRRKKERREGSVAKWEGVERWRRDVVERGDGEGDVVKERGVEEAEEAEGTGEEGQGAEDGESREDIAKRRAEALKKCGLLGQSRRYKEVLSSKIAGESGSEEQEVSFVV